ncbi:MAG: hypothetical protein AAF252_04365 [Pseudomonadota bacterium]
MDISTLLELYGLPGLIIGGLGATCVALRRRELVLIDQLIARKQEDLDRQQSEMRATVEREIAVQKTLEKITILLEARG